LEDIEVIHGADIDIEGFQRGGYDGILEMGQCHLDDGQPWKGTHISRTMRRRMSSSFFKHRSEGWMNDPHLDMVEFRCQSQVIHGQLFPRQVGSSCLLEELINLLQLCHHRLLQLRILSLIEILDVSASPSPRIIISTISKISEA